MLIPSSFCLPPVECSRGTTPIQAAELPPFAEGRSIANGGDECSRGNRPDARYRHESLAGFILMSRLIEYSVGLVDPHRRLIEFQLQLCEQNAQCAG